MGPCEASLIVASVLLGIWCWAACGIGGCCDSCFPCCKPAEEEKEEKGPIRLL